MEMSGSVSSTASSNSRDRLFDLLEDAAGAGSITRSEAWPPLRERPRRLLEDDSLPSSCSGDDENVLPPPPAFPPPQLEAARLSRRRSRLSTPVTSARMLQRGSLRSVGKALSSRCCPLTCMLQFSPQQVLKARTIFLTLSHSSASEWICQQMETFWDVPSKKWHCMLLGSEVCVNAFCLFHGISHSKWFAVRKMFLIGRRVFLHGHAHSERSSPKEDMMVKWMNEFILSNGDTLTNSEIHLPMGLRKVDLHGMMVDEMQKADPGLTRDDLPGELLFRQVWKKSFSHVRNPKKTRLGKCDLCCLLDRQRQRADAVTLQSVAKQKADHIANVKAERYTIWPLTFSARSFLIFLFEFFYLVDTTILPIFCVLIRFFVLQGSVLQAAGYRIAIASLIHQCDNGLRSEIKAPACCQLPQRLDKLPPET